MRGDIGELEAVELPFAAVVGSAGDAGVVLLDDEVGALLFGCAIQNQMMTARQSVTAKAAGTR